MGDGLNELLPFIGIGFVAQLVDGAMGMAFGVIANSLLVGFMGVAPAQASYQVHVIKCFTTGASGISHALNRNIDRCIFIPILVPGVLGGIAGAYGLAQLDGEVIKPFIFAYLSLLGLVLMLKGIRGNLRQRRARAVRPLGFIGGLLDAIGGGGWGPVVSSGLMVQGARPRHVVGSVNSAEFFIAVAIASAFFVNFGFEKLTKATLGILIGGVLAAPFGALVARYLPSQVMLVLVGGVLTTATGYWLIDCL